MLLEASTAWRAAKQPLLGEMNRMSLPRLSACHIKALVAMGLLACVCSTGCDLLCPPQLDLATPTRNSDPSAPPQTPPLPPPSRATYVASFDENADGWLADRRYPLSVHDGVAESASPWFLDYWHAPPGAGYLHLVIWMHTDERRVFEYYPGYEGNPFVEQNQSRDFTNAKLSIRVRGDIDMQGTQLVVLLQSEDSVTDLRNNYVLSGHPFPVSSEWQESSATLVPDESLWTCMGARHDRPDYGCSSIAEVLRDVNVNIIFILFPLNVVPIEDIADPHLLRPRVDYAVDETLLPQGSIMFDWVKLAYADPLVVSQLGQDRTD